MLVVALSFFSAHATCTYSCVAYPAPEGCGIDQTAQYVGQPWSDLGYLRVQSSCKGYCTSPGGESGGPAEVSPERPVLAFEDRTEIQGVRFERVDGCEDDETTYDAT